MSTILGALLDGPEHFPFELGGGERAAILVHGFPGTPAEVRAVGEALHAAGWAAHGLLLPGFGAQIDTLFERRRQEWIAAVTQKVRALRATHASVMLVGYSFGGAVALNAAISEEVDALVLAAPFWRLGGWRERVIWAFIKRIFPTFQPFRRMDFASPELRAGLSKIVPGVDANDPEVRAALRALRVPARIVDEVAALGRGAKQAARQLRVPTLIVQGLADEVAPATFTRELADAFPAPPAFLEVNAGHELLSPMAASWPVVSARILEFAAQVGNPG